MGTQSLNRLALAALSGLSAIALLDVIFLGYVFPGPPTSDEGLGAHVFQLAIAALVPTGLVFLATADWAEPSKTARRLAIPAALVVLAFAALYYLENYYHAA